MYVYEACVFKDEDGVLCADYRDFEGACVTSGTTMEELASNVKELLELLICSLLNEGIPLPKPTFHDPDDPDELEGAGHNSNTDRPDEVNEIIAKFVGISRRNDT